MKAFENVMGYESLKHELIEIIDIMQNPEYYQEFGVTCPNGLLLHGEPGLGKTLISNEFIKASGRPSIVCRKNAAVQNFIGSICDAFDEAAKIAPSILLLDDMDKFANDDDNHKDSEAYVTIQSCIDEIKGKDVFVIATANNIHKLPDSLMRTGRFDRKIKIEKPSEDDSECIIAHYLKGKKIDESIDINIITSLLRGSSCSTLETIVNQAGLLAGYRRSQKITMEDLVVSYLMIDHSVPRECMMITDELNIHADDGSVDTLWHEAGHVAMNEILAPGSVTIAIATAKAGKNVGFVESNYRNSGLNNLEKIKVNVMTSLASSAAIDITFGRVEPGAEGDIRAALKGISGVTCDLGGFAGLGLATCDSTSFDMDAWREIAASNIAELFYQETKEILCMNRDFLTAIVESFAKNPILTATDIAQIKKSCHIRR